VAETLSDKTVKVLVAVADFDALVKKNSAIDEHARQNTTSVYTAGKNFPMLPEKLSTDLTSLNDHEDRLAIVIEMGISDAGEVHSSDIYRALVRNHAKLVYNSVGAWLEGERSMPDAVAVVPGLAENLRVQDRVAQRLKARRYEHGLWICRRWKPVRSLPERRSRTCGWKSATGPKRSSRNFMVAANGVTAGFLHRAKVLSLRRMVRSPKRWGRIVEIAAQHNSQLPAEPDSRALASFLVAQKAALAGRPCPTAGRNWWD